MKLTAHISWLDLNEKAKSNGDDFSYKDTCSKFCWSFSFYSDSDFYGVWSRCSHVLVVRYWQQPPHLSNIGFIQNYRFSRPCPQMASYP